MRARRCMRHWRSVKGFFPVEELSTHYANGSRLSGHVSHKGVPGVEFSTGSLGHGLSVAAGAGAGRQEGQRRLARVLRAGRRRVRRRLGLGSGTASASVCWIIWSPSSTTTGCRALTSAKNTLALEPFGDKWRAFGWNVIETDGNDVDTVEKALRQAQENRAGGRRSSLL